MVVSGNIGSKKRMDYTMIGDGVNLASRLESAMQAIRRPHPDERIHGLRSCAALTALREIDLVVVKGKTKPVRVMEVLDYHDESTFPNLLDVVHYFNEGVQHYRKAGWHAATQRFKRCLQLNPGDALSQTYLERCQIMAANPPERDWNGVWVMKEK